MNPGPIERVLVPDVLIREHVAGAVVVDLDSFFTELAVHIPLSEAVSQVEILLTDDAEIRDLNREYRSRDKATDVLSFPDGDMDPEKGYKLLGSIVISMETAEQQAVRIGHPLDRELKFLLVHGLLHLLGFDHENDNGEMMDIQRQIIMKMKLDPEEDNGND